MAVDLDFFSFWFVCSGARELYVKKHHVPLKAHVATSTNMNKWEMETNGLKKRKKKEERRKNEKEEEKNQPHHKRRRKPLKAHISLEVLVLF